MRSLSFTQRFALLLIVCAVLLCASDLHAWTGPTATPPGGNVPTPINVGTTDQVKNAGLSVNAFAAFGNAYFAGNVGIGTTNPAQKLVVNGNAWVNGNFVVRSGIATIGSGSGDGTAQLSITGDASGSDGIYISTISGKPNTSPSALILENNLGNAVAGESAIHEVEVDYNGAFRIERPQDITRTPDFVITSAGQVGINTYTPGATLGVNTHSGYGINVIDSDNSYGVYSTMTDPGGVAIDGDNTSTGARGALGYANYGVYCIAGLCGGGNSWNSDARLKRDIQPLAPSNVLAKLMQLEPVSFHWKDAKQDALEGEKFGFIAQDVRKVFPNMVVDSKTPKTITLADGSTSTVPDVLTLDYTDLIPLAVLGVQDLTKQVTAQQQEIYALKAEVEALKAAR